MAHCVHLDYASSAPLRPSARKAIAESLESDFFDPRRLYDDAIRVRYEIEESRELIASIFGCDPFEVIFTSSHSESLASFCYGVLDDEQTNDIDVIISPFDSDVIEQSFKRESIDIEFLETSDNGQLDSDSLQNQINEKTKAVSFPWVHPDTGSFMDLRVLSEVVKSKNYDPYIFVDARLAAGNVDIDFNSLEVDGLAIDPVTFGGPSGIAAMIVSRKKRLRPLFVGATQERARRAGLENYLGIKGFAAAAKEWSENKNSEGGKIAEFAGRIENWLISQGATLLVENNDSKLDSITSAYFEGFAASAIVAQFNRHGINIHAGSSCGSEEFEPSRALLAITDSNDLAESVFRISIGWNTSEEDIAHLESIENIRG